MIRGVSLRQHPGQPESPVGGRARGVLAAGRRAMDRVALAHPLPTAGAGGEHAIGDAGIRTTRRGGWAAGGRRNRAGVGPRYAPAGATDHFRRCVRQHRQRTPRGSGGLAGRNRVPGYQRRAGALGAAPHAPRRVPRAGTPRSSVATGAWAPHRFGRRRRWRTP